MTGRIMDAPARDIELSINFIYYVHTKTIDFTESLPWRSFMLLLR